jgi:hypothetical protein
MGFDAQHGQEFIFYQKTTAHFRSHQPTVRMTVDVKSRRSASEHPGVLTNKLEEEVEIKFCSSMWRGVEISTEAKIYLFSYLAQHLAFSVLTLYLQSNCFTRFYGFTFTGCYAEIL